MSVVGATRRQEKADRVRQNEMFKHGTVPIDVLRIYSASIALLDTVNVECYYFDFSVVGWAAIRSRPSTAASGRREKVHEPKLCSWTDPRSTVDRLSIAPTSKPEPTPNKVAVCQWQALRILQKGRCRLPHPSLILAWSAMVDHWRPCSIGHG